jgi:hypothetical protein
LSSQKSDTQTQEDIVKIEGYDNVAETYIGRHRDDFLVFGLSCNEIDPALVGMYFREINVLRNIKKLLCCSAEMRE